MCDVDWASDVGDQKSTSASAIFVGPNLNSWLSRKERVIAHSSTEAEYCSLAQASSELVWIQAFRRNSLFPSPLQLCFVTISVLLPLLIIQCFTLKLNTWRLMSFLFVIKFSLSNLKLIIFPALISGLMLLRNPFLPLAFSFYAANSMFRILLIPHLEFEGILELYLSCSNLYFRSFLFLLSVVQFTIVFFYFS